LKSKVRRWTLPDTKYAPGFYGGEVVEIAFDIDDESEDKPVVGFRVRMDDYPEEPCWCWHKAYGTRQDGSPHVEKTKAIVEALGGTWADLDLFPGVGVGKRVSVGVFHNQSQNGKKTYENCYIVLGGKRGKADPKAVTSALSKLTGKTLDTGLPF
jgi:hypothetical protein